MAGDKPRAGEDPRPPDAPTTIEVRNQTGIALTVILTVAGWTAESLEPGATARFTVWAPGYTVSARPLHPGDRRRVASVSRFYTAQGVGECSPLITVTKEPVGSTGNETLRLSDAVTCSPDEPPQDPGLPSAAARWRESLLMALCSGGLIGLAVVGMLINRHE
jgi:hypothetical protein